MATEHVVVDGSNIATEGRQTPSLAQLEQALTELRRDMPDAEMTVVVDATFAHRIDPSEVPRYEQAAAKNELVSPPAGAIGRGDAFLLRIAERINGIVLSNDSFQEFHGEHPWLFERGRLIGAVPVAGIGWIFMPRQPVRGARSRVAARDGTRARKQVEQAIEQATREAVGPAAPGESAPATGRRARPTARAPEAMNAPATFIRFVAEQPLGTTIEGEVKGFTSHGAVISYGELECYVPLAHLGDPPPRSAREVLKKGERREFVVTALDPYRRGVEVALPQFAAVSGRPTEETVAAEVGIVRRRARQSERGDKASDSAEAAPRGPRRRRPPGSDVADPATLADGARPARARAAPGTAASASRRRRAPGAPVPAAAAPAEAPPGEKSVRRQSTGRRLADRAAAALRGRPREPTT